MERKIKLLYDLKACQPNDSGKVHGGGNYAIVVFFELAREYASQIECVYDANIEIREDILSLIKAKSIPLHDLNTNPLDKIVRERNIDTYYTACTDFQVKTIPGIRNICTVHGLRELEMPLDWWQLKYRTSTYKQIKTFITLILGKRWKNILLKRVRRTLTQTGLDYVTVSNHTKYSCLSFLPELSSENISVCYSPSTIAADFYAKPFVSANPYVLIVSGNRPEKNALRALVAIDELISEHSELKNLKIIITGATEKTFRHHFINSNQFEMLGYVDEELLQSLYTGAKIFIYPSLNEGFGYPPLEAMHYGVPVIASSSTSIPEVCGEAVMYVNPFDIQEMKGRILRLLTDKECWEYYHQKGRDRFEVICRKQENDLKNLVKFIMTNPSQVQ